VLTVPGYPCHTRDMNTTHPQMAGTLAEDCPECFERTYGVALDCAWENMNGAEGVDPFDEQVAESWARSYVEAGDVSAYYCTTHDPINN
jgi:hypothetical protein